MRPTVLALAALLLISQACTATTSTSPPAAAPPQAAATAASPPGIISGAPAPISELDRPLPVDARVKVGRLSNGLAYYILPHRKPEKRAELWLAVNAGSVQEDDDQRGLAHFVEHMGFNGTKRFPKQDLVNFIERIGVKFGPDLNAYTSFDETVYMLRVPTDKAELLEKAFHVLRDWAGGISFDPGEVEKERGVVLEEWRLGRGAGMRIFDKQAPVLFHRSKYADRIVIGKAETIKGAPREALVRYYRDWYRPDLMALIAVGDFAADEIERRIKSEFTDLPKAAAPRPRPVVELPAHRETLVSIETDAEMPSAGVTVFNKMPHRAERSAGDYRRAVAEQIYHAMLNARLDEIRRKPDAPFLFASSSTGDFLRSTDAFVQQATVKEDGVERALAALLEEALRVERHGFTETELGRAKKVLLRQYQQSVLQRDKKDARELASEIVRHFLEGEMMPGIEAELALVERFLPTLALPELNALAKSWGGESRVIAVTGPAKMKKPTPEALLAVTRAAEGRTLKAYEDAVASTPLLAAPPKTGRVTATRSIPEIGVTEWKLSNGVRVVVKPTDFKNDEISFVAFSPGGHSLVKDADFESARFADVVVSEGGLGTFDAVQLRKTLSGKIASVRPRVGELEEGLGGGGSPEDLETLLQLVHLTFTAPRRDETAFKTWRAREVERARNRLLSPETSFFEAIQVLTSQNHRRRQPTTPEVLDKVDLDRALAIYRDRFAEAGDFTFVFVGNIQLERLRPLAETYLGSLPTKGRKEKWRDVLVRWPKGLTTKTVVKGQEPKSMVFLAFHGSEKWTRDTENDMRMLGEVLRIRLREVMREDLGGVYGVNAGGGISRRPRQEYVFRINFGCAPDNVEKLKQAIFDEIKALQEKGVADDYLKKVKEARLRAHEVDLKENSFWSGELTRAYTFGDDPRLIPDIQPMVEKVTTERVRAAARKYLKPREYVLGVLQPEKVAAATSAQPAGP